MARLLTPYASPRLRLTSHSFIVLVIRIIRHRGVAAKATAATLARGAVGKLRWSVVTLDPLHVLHVCNSRQSVGSGAMSTPPVDAALRGVAASLALLQRKHRFVALDSLDVAASLETETDVEATAEASAEAIVDAAAEGKRSHRPKRTGCRWRR